MAHDLGRVKPPDWKHVDSWPLTADTMPTKPTPGVMGIDWFSAFDDPKQDSSGKWWTGVDENFKALTEAQLEASGLRGGHAICTKPRGATDPTAWWVFYNQEDRQLPVSVYRTPYGWKRGGCTGFAIGRALTQMNRVRYDPYHLYHENQEHDVWPGSNYEGSSVRASMDVARDIGPRPVVRGVSKDPDPKQGIAANRWARDAEDFAQASGYGGLEFVDLLQSWGRLPAGWPHVVRLPLSIVQILLQRDGELAVVTDR